MYIKSAKYGVASAAIGLGLHFFSHGYVSIEAAAAEKLSATKKAVIYGLAEDFGFVEKQPEETPLGPVALCTMEATKRNINPALACSNMHEESKKNQLALSKKGAVGLMQVMPSNIPMCGECGVKTINDLLHDKKNICCGVLILDRFLKENKNDPVDALQAYNGGKGCIDRCSESINHMRKVLTHLSRSNY